MKLLVKFELKFLNFFTLKNLNNKKNIFLLPKNNCVHVLKQKYKCKFNFINYTTNTETTQPTRKLHNRSPKNC